MNRDIYQKYVDILKNELVAALGCTEPIALAYAGAVASETLGEMPDKILVKCSGNIIKNVKGVTVPNSNGEKGVEIAVILGVLVADSSRELEILEGVDNFQIEKAKELRNKGYCSVELVEGVSNLYIDITIHKGLKTARVEISGGHTNIINLEKNGERISRYTNKTSEESATESADKGFMSIEGIFEFVSIVRIDDIRHTIEKQIVFNKAIANEGLKNVYGANVGKHLLEKYGERSSNKAKALAAAGADARMSGSDLPVVINSGSGNQGLTVSLPVIQYSEELGVDEETRYKALVLSNLLAILLKSKIGSLSAFCGVVTAAAGSGAAITYLHKGSKDQIINTITNTLAVMSGMVCDGAKPSCAAKIASSLDAAIFAHELAMNGEKYDGGTGIIGDSIEETIENVTRVAKEGMKQTDIEILNVMIGR